MALGQGLKVQGITLMLFGGVSKIQGQATRPRNEFWIAFSGPAVSFVIGIVLTVWWEAFKPEFQDQVKLYHGVIFFAGRMNILVAVFNLLPGFPMDGGRVLRSIVWAITGNSERATSVAFVVGRYLFYAFIGFGIWQIMNGDVANGIWIAMIGWFLMSSARSEVRGERASRGDASSSSAATSGELDHLTFEVGRATRPMPPMVESNWSIEQLSYQGMPANPLTSMPVAKQGELIGFVLRQDLDGVPLERKSSVTVGELMSPDSLRVISRHDSVGEALRVMDRSRLNQLVVMDNDYVIGIVTRDDIIKALLELRTTTDQTDSNAGDGPTSI